MTPQEIYQTEKRMAQDRGKHTFLSSSEFTVRDGETYATPMFPSRLMRQARTEYNQAEAEIRKEERRTKKLLSRTSRRHHE